MSSNLIARSKVSAGFLASMFGWCGIRVLQPGILRRWMVFQALLPVAVPMLVRKAGGCPQPVACNPIACMSAGRAADAVREGRADQPDAYTKMARMSAKIAIQQMLADVKMNMAACGAGQRPVCGGSSSAATSTARGFAWAIIAPSVSFFGEPHSGPVHLIFR
ncbi:MAG: hypothetical protein R3C70_01485 [Geminicoccaceae bacterium]